MSKSTKPSGMNFSLIRLQTFTGLRLGRGMAATLIEGTAPKHVTGKCANQRNSMFIGDRRGKTRTFSTEQQER